MNDSLRVADRRILVADDNEDIRRDVARVLGVQGRRASLGARAQQLFPELGLEPRAPEERPFGPVDFTVETASTGDEALAKARAARAAGQPIAVAFVDVRMPPGVDGARVARLLRDEDPDIEVVLITAYADRSVGELNAGTEGCDRLLFLKKPYAREELYQLALSLTEKRAHRRGARAAAERLDVVLEATQDGLVGVDADHRVTFANRAARELLGLDGIAGDALASEQLWRALALCAPRAIAGGAIELARAGRWVEVSPVARTPVLATGVHGVFAVRDVTARKEVERLKDEFVQNTSHELRTPLVAVRGYLDLALEERLGALAAPLRRGLEVARRASGRLLDLIDALLELARLEAAGDAALERHALDLAQVIDHAVDVVRPAAVAKGLELEVAVERRPALVEGDPRTLEVAVRNLLGNAIKFTEKGKVGVSATARPRGIAVEIWDTGPGLPAGLPPELLFERFRQGDGSASRAKGGVGIGLSLVERILALHGSRATATNRPEGGACFRFELEGAATPRAAAAPEPLPKGTVLVADRAGSTRAFVALLLGAAGFPVREASSAREAVHVLRDEGCRLALVEEALADEVAREAPGARVSALVVPGTTAPGASAREAAIEKPVSVDHALAAACLPVSSSNGSNGAASLPGRRPARQGTGPGEVAA